MSRAKAKIGAARPLLPPASKRTNNQGKSLPFLREQVLMALGPLLIGLPLEDALVDELLQPGRQDVVGNPGGLEVLESASTEQGVAHNQQGPPLSDHVERACHRARETGEAYMPHRTVRYLSPLQDASLASPPRSRGSTRRSRGRGVPRSRTAKSGEYPAKPGEGGSLSNGPTNLSSRSVLVLPAGHLVYADRNS